MMQRKTKYLTVDKAGVVETTCGCCSVCVLSDSDSTFTSASKHPHKTFVPHANVVFAASSMSQYAVRGGDTSHRASKRPN